MPRTGDILGYARVSTADQDLSGQKDRLLQHGAIRVFEDVISGKTFNRPGLAALLDQARPNDTLAVIRLDRLGRSLKELLETVDNLKTKEINLISLEERIDTTSAAGELVFHVFGAIAHFERRLISERTKDGLATARKYGRNPGRPPLQPETISALQDLVEAGKSVSQAAKHLARIIHGCVVRVAQAFESRYFSVNDAESSSFTDRPPYHDAVYFHLARFVTLKRQTDPSQF
ncbi:recombinase family protein [Hoeflea sp.]|uniref:recombinase family protein n=1 Tax=Hoeflea sp. TaxID=1940281 RepID=UPI003B0112AF